MNKKILTLILFLIVGIILFLFTINVPGPICGVQSFQENCVAPFLWHNSGILNSLFLIPYFSVLSLGLERIDSALATSVLFIIYTLQFVILWFILDLIYKKIRK
ncbi:MAG TPA: hypothetical protein DIT25_02915 [Candidatus Moranbacteria bacterium]|nr:hypothetical protein [Candidatus Moranbacteria bacterium]